MRVCTGGRAARRWSRPSISSRRLSTIHTPTARSPPPMRSATSTRWAAGRSTALAIAAFPKEGLEPDTIRAIFRGGFDKLREAGVSLLGGHTVQDLRNQVRICGDRRHRSGARAVECRRAAGRRPVPHQTSRHRHRRHRDQVRSRGCGARRAGRAVDANAESRGRRSAPGPAGGRGSRVHRHHRVRPDWAMRRKWRARAASRSRSTRERVPIFPGVLAIAERNRSGGMGSNQEHFGASIRVDPGVEMALELVLYDPQTSGGLLIAADARFGGRGGGAAERRGGAGAARSAPSGRR